MTMDDVLTWISVSNVKLWQRMQDNVTDDTKWNKARGAYDILEALRSHILMKTNPHNREDIKRFNEKNESEKS